MYVGAYYICVDCELTALKFSPNENCTRLIHYIPSYDEITPIIL